MSTGQEPITVIPEAWDALTRALRLDTAQEQLVEFVCEKLGIPDDDLAAMLATASPFVALCERLRADYRELDNLRVLESEYQRIIRQDAEPGRVALRLIKLWITDARTLDVKHRDGYKLSDFRGGAYLIPSGNDWEIVYADRGHAECAHETADAAAERLERLGKETRERLGRLYSALELLSREAAPQPKARKR